MRSTQPVENAQHKHLPHHCMFHSQPLRHRPRRARQHAHTQCTTMRSGIGRLMVQTPNPTKTKDVLRDEREILTAYIATSMRFFLFFRYKSHGYDIRNVLNIIWILLRTILDIPRNIYLHKCFVLLLLACSTCCLLQTGRRVFCDSFDVKGLVAYVAGDRLVCCVQAGARVF